MIRRRGGPLAAVVFFALTTPLGIAVHLISELAGLGWHDDAALVFSARHSYLAALALLALVGLLLALRAVPGGERRARVATLVESLPFHGRGFRFTVLSFLAQFAFFAVTQIGEGAPLCDGDVVFGIVAAAVAALLGALAVTFGQRRVLEFVLALVSSFIAAPCDCIVANSVLRRRAQRASATRRSPFSFRYRPPPAAAARLSA